MLCCRPPFRLVPPTSRRASARLASSLVKKPLLLTRWLDFRSLKNQRRTAGTHHTSAREDLLRTERQQLRWRPLRPSPWRRRRRALRRRLPRGNPASTSSLWAIGAMVAQRFTATGVTTATPTASTRGTACTAASPGRGTSRPCRSGRASAETGVTPTVAGASRSSAARDRATIVGETGSTPLSSSW